MQEKDMFLKKNKLLIIFIFFFTIFLTKNSFSYNEEQKGIIEYLNKPLHFAWYAILISCIVSSLLSSIWMIAIKNNLKFD